MNRVEFKPTIIVNEFREIVNKVSESILSDIKSKDSFIEGVHYMHGHPIEVAKALAERGKSNEFKFKKYPLIALLQDFPENKTGEIGLESSAQLHIIICKGTDPNYTAERRYKENFEPFLYPVYSEFLSQLSMHRKFSFGSSEMIEHTKVDRLYWGVAEAYGNKKNIFMDHLDIIEIMNLKVKVKANYC